MTRPADAGRHVEVVFTEEDTVLEVDLPDADASDSIVDALLSNELDEAESLFRDVSGATVVRRVGRSP